MSNEIYHAHIISKHGRKQRFTAEQFATKHASAVEPLYLALRGRGFSRFDSFVAAFGEDYAGLPTAIETACGFLESEPEWLAFFESVLKNTPAEDLIAYWDKHAALSKAKTSIAVEALRPRVDELKAKEVEKAKDIVAGMRDTNAERDQAVRERSEQRQGSMGDYDRLKHTKPVISVNGARVGKADENDPLQGTVKFFKEFGEHPAEAK